MTDEEQSALIEACAKQVPTTWLDSLLTGPNKVVPANTDARIIEPLLQAVAARIRSLKTNPPPA